MNIIEIENISKKYPGKNRKANSNISLELRKGEILCIAGENGAGKTTLMKILTGLEKQDEGFVRKSGTIGMVHQHFMLFPEYTSSVNIVMGNEPRKFGIFFDKKKAKNAFDKIAKENNFTVKSSVKVKDLTLGEMQQVEICRILYRNADIIILDEPTSILTEFEIESLFKNIKNLVLNGKSVILITHKLKEIKKIGDRVAVLRKGELIGVREVREIDGSEIADMMIGAPCGLSRNAYHDVSLKESGADQKNNESGIKGNAVISFNNVTVKRFMQKRHLLDNISFSVNSGEILGFAGVGGNGLGVIEAVLGGFLHPASGKIFHNGNDITHLSSRALRNQGLSYVPADRIRTGSAQDATIKENIIINHRRDHFKFKKSGVNKQNNNSDVSFLMNDYNIDIPNLKAKALTLSGGNLQKLILAREISGLKDYIVFSQPTWGLDITSSGFMMEKIKELKKNNAAIILISTDLDEILALSDRINVMYRGKIAGVYKNDGDESLKEKIGKNMQGVF